MNRGLDLIGRQIGVYRIEELIGAGGYSRVYRGRDKTVGRMAAIKMLLPSAENEGYADPVIQRFEREARIVANLRDPHSVLLYEYGQTDDGLLYMIFEYIEGHTLEEIRRQQFALPALRVVKILEQILLSLEEAHALGLIHRDIKPANIMVFEHIGRTDQVKVLDFGVGKATDGHAESTDLTQTGMLIGTPRYMAPEQWSSDGEISPQTDIYSLGLVTYELLTGSRAITASDPVHIMRAHLDRHPIRLPDELDIPSGLRQVVNTMLHKDRARRYPGVRAVLADLMRLKPMGVESNTMLLNEAKLEDALTADATPQRVAQQPIQTSPQEQLTHTTKRPVLGERPDDLADKPITPQADRKEAKAVLALARPRRLRRSTIAILAVLCLFVGGYILFLAFSPPKDAQISGTSDLEAHEQEDGAPGDKTSLAAASGAARLTTETAPHQAATPMRVEPVEIATDVMPPQVEPLPSSTLRPTNSVVTPTSASNRDTEKTRRAPAEKTETKRRAPAASAQKPSKPSKPATQAAKNTNKEPKLQIWGIE